jgi:hypothetical protein
MLLDCADVPTRAYKILRMNFDEKTETAEIMTDPESALSGPESGGPGGTNSTVSR